ncbi:hypothetical protein HKBW3S42_00544, partial [Candidatus Hakubella thermalkaliphila]
DEKREELMYQNTSVMTSVCQVGFWLRKLHLSVR